MSDDETTMKRLDVLYDFVDLLKHRNDLDDVTLSVIAELREEYNAVKQSVSGKLSAAEIVKKLKFVMSCEYQTLLKKCLQDTGNLNALAHNCDLMRMLTESVIEVVEPPELSLQVVTQPNIIALEDKGVQISTAFENDTTQKQEIEFSGTLSESHELQQLMVNEYIRRFSYQLQKISLISKTNKSNGSVSLMLDKLMEFSDEFKKIDDVDTVLLEDDNIKNVQTISDIVNSDNFNNLLRDREAELVFCRRLQTFALRMTLNNVEAKNKAIISNNPDIEMYILQKRSNVDRQYDSAKNIFPVIDIQVPEIQSERHVRDFYELSSNKLSKTTEDIKVDIKKSGSHAIFSSFFEKHKRSKLEDAKELQNNIIKEGDSCSPILHTRSPISKTIDKESFFEEYTDKPSVTTRPDRQDAEENEELLNVNYKNQSAKRNQVAVYTESKLLSPLSNSVSGMQKSKVEQFGDTAVNRDILMSEINKTSKLSMGDLVSQPNSKNASQDRELLKDVIRNVKLDQRIEDVFETSQTIKEIKIGIDAYSNIFETKEKSRQSENNPDGTAAANQIISKINKMQEKRNDQLQSNNTAANENNKIVEPGHSFVNLEVADSFRDMEPTAGLLEPKRNITMSKVTESDDFELDNYLGKDLKFKMLSNCGFSEDNIFQNEDAQNKIEDKEQRTLLDVPSARGKASDAKYDVKTSIKTNYTEMFRSETIGHKDNNFYDVLTNKTTLVVDKNYGAIIFSREFSKLLNKFKQSHCNVVEISKPARYIDCSFLPCSSSVLDSWDASKLKSWRFFEWRRLSYMYPSGTIFTLKNDGFQFSDGSYSNHDLLTIMLSLQRYEASLIDKVLHDFKPQIGKFAIRSLSNGQITYLDDFVPIQACYNSVNSIDTYNFPFIAPELEGAKANILFTLVEKFCAKTVGSYQKLKEMQFDDLIKLFSLDVEEVDLSIIRDAENQLLNSFLADLYGDFKEDARIIYFVKENENVKFCRYIKKANYEFLLEDYCSQMNYSFSSIAQAYDKMVVVKYNL